MRSSVGSKKRDLRNCHYKSSLAIAATPGLFRRTDNPVRRLENTGQDCPSYTVPLQPRKPRNAYNTPMARWPRHVWTSIFTYATVFVLFPLLCLLAYAWVRGWIF